MALDMTIQLDSHGWELFELINFQVAVVMPQHKQWVLINYMIIKM
jgi:hypothetical protein